jgi:FAD/FMN-containing dehydrogenase
MATSEIVARAAAGTLQSRIAGRVLAPGDLDYDHGRAGWNLAVEQRPSIVVHAESVADVVEAVRFARSQGMRIAPQGTGHGASPLEPLEGVLLLKTSAMRGVELSASARTARAEAGALWQDVTVPADRHGLAALAGGSPAVGVTGYTLGGGIGWLARKYGLAANSLTAVEIVTPDGHPVRADADHEPDLFWAVRGGGGGVGVVTALEMTLYPVRHLYAGVLFFPIERSPEVLHAWRKFTQSAPDELTSLARLLRLPPAPELPETLRGRAFVSVEAAYLGDTRQGAELLAPLRALGPQLDTFALIPASALGQLHMDPTQPVPAVGDGTLLVDLPSGAIDKLLELAGPGVESPLLSVEVRHLGGALERTDPLGAGAQARIEAAYAVFAVGITPTVELRRTVSAQVRALIDTLGPWRARYDFYNFAETPKEAHSVLADSAYQRLRDIKARYDPDQTIVSAHPVRLADHA